MDNDEMELYLKYKFDTNLTMTESNISPMHPGIFYNLSQIYKFNDVNGHSYQEYLTIWKKRYNILDIDYITVVTVNDNGTFKTTLYKKAFIDNSGHIRLPPQYITKGVYERITNKNYYDLPTL
jgi:hypothetical protein